MSSMSLKGLVIAGLSASVAAIPVARAMTDWTNFINLFIGTQGTVPGTSYNGGNVFPGASIPFGE